MGVYPHLRKNKRTQALQIYIEGGMGGGGVWAMHSKKIFWDKIFYFFFYSAVQLIYVLAKNFFKIYNS